MTATSATMTKLAATTILCAIPIRAWALEEVVVTATRTAVALADYPGSATRIAADSLELTGATHSAELQNRAPGTMIQRGSGQESLTALRSPVLTGAGACGAVLVLEDGIPIRPVGSCNVNELFEVNLEQAAAVEILRGPGSVLYGSSAVHGIFNVLPPLPDELPDVGVALETGSDKYRRFRLAASSQSDQNGLGVALHATDDGGWRDASGFEEQKLNAVWTRPLARGALTLRVAGSNLDQETAGFIPGENAFRDREIARSNPDPEAYRDATSLRFGARYRDEAGHEIRAYLRSSRMDFLQHFLLGQPIKANGQDSGGLFTAALEQGEQITAGDDVDTAPRGVHRLRLRRESPRLAAELEWLHVGRYWSNAANTARYGGHDLANLHVSARPREHWSLTLSVSNLFDEAYADRADFAFGDHRYFPGRGRAYFLELGWRED